MKTLKNLAWIAAAGCVTILANRAGWTHPLPAKDRASILLSHALPKLAGDHLKATLVDVRYGPGESSPPHSHSCPVIVHVVEGAIRTQVQGELETTYKVGDSFYEGPNSVHAVSANASATEPAEFVAVLICDHEGPLSTNVPARNMKGN